MICQGPQSHVKPDHPAGVSAHHMQYESSLLPHQAMTWGGQTGEGDDRQARRHHGGILVQSPGWERFF